MQYLQAVLAATDTVTGPLLLALKYRSIRHLLTYKHVVLVASMLSLALFVRYTYNLA